MERQESRLMNNPDSLAVEVSKIRAMEKRSRIQPYAIFKTGNRMKS